MIQDIIVITIVGLTAGYIIFGFIKNLRRSKKSTGCAGCTGCGISKDGLSCTSSIKKF